jgi:hypothetical protein
VRQPNHHRFVIECPGAWRARSFHVELVIPEGLRFVDARLHAYASADPLGPPVSNASRASLYAAESITTTSGAEALAVVAPERSGRTVRAVLTSLVVAALLWLGVASDLDSQDPSAAVSLLLAGAAFFSGVFANQGEHQIVRRVFATTRRWLTITTFSALAGSATVAFGFPTEPITVWLIAAAASTAACFRLAWAAVRAPS